MGKIDFLSGANGPLLPGTLEMLILKTLATSQMNGADIAASIRNASEGSLNVKEGALYPALHRLQERGFLECAASLSRNNRHAKSYRLSTSGIKELERQRAGWERLANAIGKIMEQP